jgi:NADH dehydrogenase FAD-containing subunit
MAETLRNLVFVGGGHAHVYALKRARAYATRGARVWLVNPGPHLYYSATSVGLVGGWLRPEDTRIDVKRLVERGGGTFVPGRTVAIDTGQKQIILEEGALPYDVASVNMGSVVPAPPWLPAEVGVPVKPLLNLQRARERIEARLSARTQPVRVTVVGGGAAGCEIAGNIDRFARGRGEHERVEITLLETAPRLLPAMPEAASARVAENFEARGIAMRTGVRAGGWEDAALSITGGGAVPSDLVIWAAGIEISPIFRESGLPTAPDGSLAVNECLQCESDPALFGGGDCVAICGGEPLPRVGVYAVRAGKVLHRNLLAFLDGRPLIPYRPQRRYLLILNLGDGRGLSVRGTRVASGRLSLAVKSWLDRRFLSTYAT